MKFQKKARDITGMLLEEGDIILLSEDGSTVSAVVSTIRPSAREEYPNIEIKKVTTNWLGKVTGVKKEVIGAGKYKRSRKITPASLRDDVPAHEKIKEIRDEVIEEIFNR